MSPALTIAFVGDQPSQAPNKSIQKVLATKNYSDLDQIARNRCLSAIQLDPLFNLHNNDDIFHTGFLCVFPYPTNEKFEAHHCHLPRGIMFYRKSTVAILLRTSAFTLLTSRFSSGNIHPIHIAVYLQIMRVHVHVYVHMYFFLAKENFSFSESTVKITREHIMGRKPTAGALILDLNCSVGQNSVPMVES